MVVLVASCSVVREQSDYDLQWDKYSARLTILDDDGHTIEPFGGQYVGIPGNVFAGGAIIMHPGKHRINYICKLPPGTPFVTDIAPSVEIEFKAGHKYELMCRNGKLSWRNAD